MKVMATGTFPLGQMCFGFYGAECEKGLGSDV